MIPKKEKWKKENLQKIIADNQSVSAVLKALNISYTGANRLHLYEYIKQYGLDISHWKGQSVSRPTANHLTKIPIEHLLIENSPISGTLLKKRLISEKVIEYRCFKCKITEYNGSPISLQLHHINGNNKDQRIENIILLCPNCHSQTNNYGGKSKDLIVTQENTTYTCKLCNKVIWNKKYTYCGDCWYKYRKEILLSKSKKLLT